MYSLSAAGEKPFSWAPNPPNGRGHVVRQKTLPEWGATLFDVTLENESDTFDIGGELTVNRLGYGAMRLTGEDIIGRPDDEEEARRVLHEVVSTGTNFIDTADSYGPAVSERLIGEALHPYPLGPRRRHEGRPLARRPRRLVAEMRRTGLHQERHPRQSRPPQSRHDRPLPVPPTGPGRPVRGRRQHVRGTQRRGEGRHVGLSNVSVEQLEEARDIVDIATVQNQYNVGNREHEDVLEAVRGVRHRLHPVVPARRGRPRRQGGRGRRNRRRTTTPRTDR